MSNRSLFEFNHDHGMTIKGQKFARAAKACGIGTTVTRPRAKKPGYLPVAPTRLTDSGRTP